MKNYPIQALLIIAFLILTMPRFGQNQQKPISKIVFGSCLDQEKKAPIWTPMLQEKPDIFMMIGDNIYSDTDNPAVLRRNYQKLIQSRPFQQMRQQSQILAIWDDHDYGLNDAGSEYPLKKESQQEFLHAFAFPSDSPLYQQKGLYQSYFYGPKNQRIQVILLDTRYFRTPYEKRFWGMETLFGKPQNSQPQATILGAQQWAWLEQELQKSANIRLLVTSIQLIPDRHRHEKWQNFPRERKRMLDLLAKQKSDQLIILSGDRHIAELSIMEQTNGQKLYELTASPFNRVSPIRLYNYNPYRIYRDYQQANYGKIEIRWQKPRKLYLSIHNVHGKIIFRHGVAIGGK